MDSEEEKVKQEKEKVKQQKEAAANLVRSKLSALYDSEKEPQISDDIKEIRRNSEEKKSAAAHAETLKKTSQPSKHQKYLDELAKSGRSLAEIQQAWHNYYQKLPDKEKHDVWQEFYDEHARRRSEIKKKTDEVREEKVVKEHKDREEENKKARKPASKKDELLRHVAERAKKTQKKPHAHALLFGLGMGTLFIFIILFSFFNERFITPFIRPNQNVSATAIITDPSDVGNIGKDPKIIIPKINVEAPVVYNVDALSEKAVQKGLESGVVHYSITPDPGEKGNSVIVGHSSSNIFNSGKYKFAFLLLKSLNNGDTFYVQKNGKRYVYRVFNKYVTSPTDLSVLNPTDRLATVTLITCDPPGLSVNRLIVQGEQIYPDPKLDKDSSVDVKDQTKPAELAGNSVSLWQRFKDWISGN
jgi:sortase A